MCKNYFLSLVLLASTNLMAQEAFTLSEDLYIGEALTVSGDFTITGNAQVVVAPGATLEVGGDLTQNSSNNLQLQADGSGYAQMKISGSYSGSGSVEHQANLSTGWRMIGASMNATTASYFGNVGTTGSGHTVNTQNLFSWDGTQYVNVVDATAAISPGTGYFGYVGTYGFQAAGVASFTGTPNTSLTPSLNNGTAIQEVTIEGGLARDGWNLVANPFTCALDFNELSPTNVDNAFYIYDGTSYQAYSGGGITKPYIAPHQSFWVKANASSPSLGTLSMADDGIISQSPTFYKTQGPSFDRLVLRTQAVQDSLAHDYTVVAFVNGTQDGYDAEYDAYKMANGANHPNLYSYHQGVGMANNAIDYGPGYGDAKSLEIAFRAPQHGESYQISYDPSYMLHQYEVYIEDRKTQSFQQINQQAYVFTHDSSMVNRFVLHLQSKSVGAVEFVAPAKDLQAWTHQGDFYVLANYSSQATLSLYRITGEKITDSEIALRAGSIEKGALPKDLAAGVYLLSIASPEKNQHFKVYLP